MSLIKPEAPLSWNIAILCDPHILYRLAALESLWSNLFVAICEMGEHATDCWCRYIETVGLPQGILIFIEIASWILGLQTLYEGKMGWAKQTRVTRALAVCCFALVTTNSLYCCSFNRDKELCSFITKLHDKQPL